MKHIAMALLGAQRQIKNASKDAKNPHFKNDYATLESVIDAVKDIANSCGILIVQGNGADELGSYVNTTVIHAESGESITSKIYLSLDKNNMQGLGSAITYARRYSLAAMFCITQADDDGNGASQPQQNAWSMKQFQPTPEEAGKGFSHDGIYRIPSGTHKGRTIKAVYDIIGQNKLEDTVIKFEERIKQSNPYSGFTVEQMQKFVDEAANFINSLNQEISDFEKFNGGK